MIDPSASRWRRGGSRPGRNSFRPTTPFDREIWKIHRWRCQVIDRGTNQTKLRIRAHRYRRLRTVGKMAGHIVRPDPSSSALMKRWGSAPTVAAPQAHRHLSQRLLPVHRRYRHVSFETMLGPPRTTTRRVTGDIIGRDNPRKARRQSGASRGAAAGQRPVCKQTDQDLPKKSTQPCSDRPPA
jgi:hypothetical protein